MASGSDPKTWVPYMNSKDCSQGFCSIYCPKWCYIMFSPPPPFELPDDDSTSKPKFSPLVIAIIGILASAFLLVSYYTIISKYCGNTNTDTSRRGERDQSLDDPDENLAGNQNPSVHEPSQTSNTGLDKALIKLITVFKYKRQESLTVEGTDCSICLGEFKEDESLRILPKCSHAFHVSCIDRWLKSHSNCPLCRTNIMVFAASSPSRLLLPQATRILGSQNQYSTNIQRIDGNGISAVGQVQDVRREVVEVTEANTFNDVAALTKSPIHGFIDSSEKGDTIIEIREAGTTFRRSVSMDHSSNELLVSDVWHTRQDEEDVCPRESFSYVGSPRQAANGSLRCSSYRNRVLDCGIRSPVSMMQRSFSSGGVFLAGK